MLTKIKIHLLYHEFSKKNTIVRRFVNIALAWEGHLNINMFTLQTQSQKPRRDFIQQNKLRNEEKRKTSNPEYVDENMVYDAKYKYMPRLYIEEVRDSDLNKLIRDMLVFQKKKYVQLMDNYYILLIQFYMQEHPIYAIDLQQLC